MKQKIERLRSLMEKATPGDLTTAERAQDEFIECPICLGAGEVEARDYCNIDHKALGVQFYGIGPEFGTHEALWSECINSLPDLLSHIDALEARVEEAEKNEEEAYDIGKRDGYSDSVQRIDIETGGEGEYRYCLGNEGSERHCPDPGAMKIRIQERFAALAERAEAAERALAEAVKERDALRSASTIIRQRDEAVEVLEEVAKEALIHADLKIRSFPKADQSDVEFIRKALIKIDAFLTKMGEK